MAARGVQLAPRGSSKDVILQEVVRRERNEKFSLVSMLANLIGKIAGFSPVQIEGMIDLYTLELYQEGYRPSVVAALRNARTKRRQKSTKDNKLLEKVEKFTVSDEEYGKATKKKRRR